MLLLDEPTAHLDPETAERLMDDVLDAAERPDRAADHAPPRGARAHGRDRPPRRRPRRPSSANHPGERRHAAHQRAAQTLRIARWPPSPDSRKKVLILGGGFAGIGAARKLEDADVDIVLVDKHNYHTFQPLLYQVATDLLEEAAVGHPLRDLFHDQPNVTVHRANATGIDLAKRTVEFEDLPTQTYDYLVLGLGADVNFFGTRAPPSTRSRCTRSPTRCGCARTCSRNGRRPTRIRR